MALSYYGLVAEECIRGKDEPIGETTIYTSIELPITDCQRMAEPPKEEINKLEKHLAELEDVVKRALIEVGDLQVVEEKLKEIVKRHSAVRVPRESGE